MQRKRPRQSLAAAFPFDGRPPKTGPSDEDEIAGVPIDLVQGIEHGDGEVGFTSPVISPSTIHPLVPDDPQVAGAGKRLIHADEVELSTS